MGEGHTWRERLDHGRAAFNRGEFFEAHELWEDAWRVLAGPARGFVQGLIQIAAGLHHLQSGRPAPAARLLRKGLDKLSRGSAPPGFVLPVEPLVQQIHVLIAELALPTAGPPPDARTIKM